MRFFTSASVLSIALLLSLLLSGCGEKPIPERKVHTSTNGIETMDMGYMRKKLTALEVAELMGNGINLGNTMEAFGHRELGIDAEVSRYETFWGQPVTTQAMISGMKEAGFDSLRIPVAWTNMMDYESGNYTINEAYLDRVEEIINYALNKEMYVVVNEHWDGGWLGMFGSATPSIREAGMEMYTSMWTQIAERYKEYSDYLIFESANEELGDRLNEVFSVPDSNTLSKDECYETANQINQAFVDTVRGTGGNNKHRFLLIAGYNTDIAHTVDDRFIMPEDSTKEKLLVSVHYYTPWGYTGGPSISRWGLVKEYEEMNDLFAQMEKFTQEKYGVIIGEYMVHLAADGTVKENAEDFTHNLLDNCDIYGYVPMLWNTGDFFVKDRAGMIEEDLAEVYSRRSFEVRADWSREEIAAAAERQMSRALEKAAEKDQEAELAGALTSLEADTAIAWIMFNSNDWAITYNVGDVYNPQSKTDGLETLDVEITEAGSYTVGLDFTGTESGYAVSTAFSALGIYMGELIFPDYIVTIKEVLVNGESYPLVGRPFTTSDDNITTRVNLYNGWVTEIPEQARIENGDISNTSAIILNNQSPSLQRIERLKITFDYGPRS